MQPDNEWQDDKMGSLGWNRVIVEFFGGSIIVGDEGEELLYVGVCLIKRLVGYSARMGQIQWMFLSPPSVVE